MTSRSRQKAFGPNRCRQRLGERLDAEDRERWIDLSNRRTHGAGKRIGVARRAN